MSWRSKANPSGKRATFQRIVVGSEVHDAFLRWATKIYLDNIHFVAKIVQEIKPPSPQMEYATYSKLLDKVASPLIYLEMDWQNLPKPEKAKYACGAYAEQLARQIQEENNVKAAAQRETQW